MGVAEDVNDGGAGAVAMVLETGCLSRTRTSPRRERSTRLPREAALFQTLKSFTKCMLGDKHSIFLK